MTTLPDTAPLDLAAPWGGRSETVDLDGPVHWVDFGGPEGSAPVVLVHGLGGSHLNWVQVAPALAEHRRVVAIDLAGFGLTPGHVRDTSVRANAALLGRFVREVVGAPAVLVGNSMGGMVSLLLTASDPGAVAGLVLVDPSIPTPRARPDRLVALQFGIYATPWVGERFLVRMRERYTDRQRVEATVRLCFADPRLADAEVTDAAVALTAFRGTQPGQERAFLGAARSILRQLAPGSGYVQVIRRVRCKVLLVHGERDRLVPFAAAQRLAEANPSWQTAWLPGVGHTPQLEVPDRLVDVVVPWLSST